MAILGQNNVKKSLEVAVKHNIPALLIGETGSGKTSLVRELGQKHKHTVVRFNMTGETTVEDFVGKYELIGKESVWRDGVLLTAVKEGQWLVVDEINMALPEVITLLHSLLDDDRNLTVAMHHGEVVAAHAEFRFFATMNPPEEYAGTKDMNKALMSRFGIIEYVDYPSKPVEIKVLEANGVEEGVSTKLVDVALKLRGLREEGKLFYVCSTRDLIQWGQLVSALGIQAAYRVTVLNKAGTERTLLEQTYKDVIKEWDELDKRVADNNTSVKELLRKVAYMKSEEEKLKSSLTQVREMEASLIQAKSEWIEKSDKATEEQSKKWQDKFLELTKTHAARMEQAREIEKKTIDQAKAEIRAELERVQGRVLDAA